MTADGPIVLSTFGSLARHGYRMDVHCWQRQRWAEVDLAAFPPEMPYVGRWFRCRCGGRCRPTISKAGWASGATRPAKLPACAVDTPTS